MFVDPSWWRRGVGGVILARAEAAIAAAGFPLACLWTPEGAPAERFYERAGWAPDGRRSWHPQLDLTVVGYEKRLGASE
jgi:GNAT superfamily N-acetyltransferase